MITSAKNYTKKTNKEKKMDRLNPRTNGKSKAIQTKSHTEAYTYTLTKREEGEKISILLLPKSTSSIWDDSLPIQVFHRCREQTYGHQGGKTWWGGGGGVMNWEIGLTCIH